MCKRAVSPGGGDGNSTGGIHYRQKKGSKMVQIGDKMVTDAPLSMKKVTCEPFKKVPMVLSTNKKVFSVPF